MNKLNKYFNYIIRAIIFLADKSWGQLILIGLPILIIFSPFLLGIRVSATLDTTNSIYPLLGFYKNCLAYKSSPLVNPLILNGFASYGGAFVGFFSPINYLFFRFLPLTLAYHLLMFAYVVGGGFVVARFAQTLKCSAPAGLIAAYAFILSTNYIDLTVQANTLWLPLIFWLIILIAKQNSWRITILGGIVMGIGWLTVHANWWIISVVGALLYTLFIICTQSSCKKRCLILKYITFFGSSFIIGFIQIISSLTYLSTSVRGIGEIFYQTVSLGTLRLGSIIHLLFPLIRIPHIPAGTFITYIGILPLFFILAGLRLGKKNKKIIFWQIFALMCIIIALPYSPIMKLINYIPVLNFLREPFRWMILVLFALSILSAFGFDAWLAGNRERVKKKIYLTFKWLLILILVITIILNLVYLFFNNKILNAVYQYFDTHLYAKTSQLAVGHYHQIIEEKYFQAIEQFVYYNPQLVIQIVVLIVSLLTLRYWFFRPRSRGVFPQSAVLVLILNLIAIFPFYFIRTQTMPSFYLNKYQPQVAGFIKQNSGKVFPFLQGESEYRKLNLPYKPTVIDHFVFQSELLAPNTNMLYQIASIDGHEGLMPGRNALVLNFLGSTRAESTGFRTESLDDFKSLEEKINAFDERQNLLDLMGADYVISVFKLVEDEDFERIYTATTTQYNIPFYIYRNKNPLPFAFLANQVKYLESDNLMAKFDIIKNSRNNFHQTTFVECAKCDGLPLKTSNLAPLEDRQQFKIVQHTNTKMEIEYDSQQGNWLIVNQSNIPGWQAMIDNQPSQIYYANFVHQGIFVPSGQHKIVVEYKYPVKYFWGKIVQERF